MTRRGPKGKPPELKVVAGTDQPCRRRERIVKTIPGAPTKPAWLKGRAAKLWAEKVAAYLARGQAIVGCESSLAQFCALEAMLIDQFAKKLTPPTSQINAYRAFAAEFFDTPAAQIGSPKAPKEGKFSANLRKPESPETAGDA